MTRKYSKAAGKKIERTMHEFKHGTLESGSGGKVKSRKQAVAIALSQARREGYKVPRAHSTRKSPAQLDKEIAEFTANPKIGDPKWEREWADLLEEKHSKARMPTIDELARAFRYIEHEFVIKEGRISAKHWAEGLAFGRFAGDTDDKFQAKEALKQLPAAEWLRIAERANRLSSEQGEAPRYVKG